MEDEHIYMRHNKTLLLYHIVLPIKYRKKMITESIGNSLKWICMEIPEPYEINFIEIGYEKSKYIKKMIDNVPINNIHREELQAAMNAAEKERKFHEIINSNTVLYKLSWRETYSLKTADGEESIYSYFLKK